jgi:hypothetical protein
MDMSRYSWKHENIWTRNDTSAIEKFLAFAILVEHLLALISSLCMGWLMESCEEQWDHEDFDGWQ